jgi:hypothetical protein
LVNTEHTEHPELIAVNPFELSWMCCIEPSNLSEELRSLKIGVDSINWYKGEIDKYNEIAKRVEKEGLQTMASNQNNNPAGTQGTDEKLLLEFVKAFLK